MQFKDENIFARFLLFSCFHATCLIVIGHDNSPFALIGHDNSPLFSLVMTTHSYVSLVTPISFFTHGHLFKCTWEHAYFTHKLHMFVSLYHLISLSLSHTQHLDTTIFHTPPPSFPPTILIIQSHHFHLENRGKNRCVVCSFHSFIY